MDELPFLDEFNKFYAKRLSKYESSRQPTWAKRKNEEIIRSLSHPEFVAMLGILNRCTPESIMENQLLLEEYFIRTFDVSLELAESWVLYFATQDIRAIMPTNQIDGVRFFNDDKKIAGPSDNQDASYVNLVADIDRKDPHMNIRIGRSATKQDVLWFIDHYWETEIEPRITPKFAKPPSQRRKRQLLRNSTIYTMHKHGMKVRDIQQYIDEHFDGVTDEPLIRKIISEFKPPRDWFAEPLAYMSSLSESDKLHATFKLSFIKEPNPHFMIEKV